MEFEIFDYILKEIFQSVWLKTVSLCSIEGSRKGERGSEGGQVEDEEEHQEQESKRRKLPQRKAEPPQMTKKMQSPQDQFEKEFLHREASSPRNANFAESWDGDQSSREEEIDGEVEDKSIGINS